MVESVIHVRLSDVAQKFMAASLDLLEAVETADRALVTDRISEAADVLQALIDNAMEEGL